MQPSPFYIDWTFWAVVVSIIAIVLSQIPPIHLLLKKAKLDIELYSRIHITHKVGNPNLQLHMIINNIGGRIVKIKGISAKIKRDGKVITTLNAQNYLQHPNDTNSVLFTSFSLKPKEEWAHIVTFLNYFPKQTEKIYRESALELRKHMSEKKENNELVIAEDSYIKPFTELFNKLFIWEPGEYELTVQVEANPNQASITKLYRFTLFESDSNELRRYVEEYKYGAGIYFDSSEHTGIIIQITEV